ncbi:MAG: sigma-54-dependent Fis family transcriptional regulator [Deltaproteobacteria bacterium]|nr:MAG: sigma-54-dependent Fis family transcriptional regulator [Deltaproteobacteria bacterium]
MQQRVLLVEDDKAFRQVYASLLDDVGYTVTEASDRDEAREELRNASYPVILLDLMLPPDGSVRQGLAQLEEILHQHPNSKVVVVSGMGDTAHMLKAIESGAYDFLTKPVDPDVLLVVTARAMAHYKLEQQVQELQTSLSQQQAGHVLLGQSKAFLEAMEIAQRMAPTDLPVLLTGENGTGKELFARMLHQNSTRADQPFVVVNCAALPETLLESTLFGHMKGSFTGAHKDRKGLFVEAHGGTLFLDEIGDMPPVLQVKLLRALESGDILPVGSDQTLQVDVRLLSATNRDLIALQSTHDFRQDLYWRIKGAEVHLPSLRERRSDIPLLAAHFLNQSAALSPNGLPKSISPEAEALLLRHEWPGNLRELKFEMQRATVMAGPRATLEPADFAFSQSTQASPPTGETLPEKVEQLERREIHLALQTHDGNRTRAAETLGLSRQGLLKKMNRYGID